MFGRYLLLAMAGTVLFFFGFVLRQYLLLAMAGTALLVVAFDRSVPIVIVDEVLLLVLFKL